MSITWYGDSWLIQALGGLKQEEHRELEACLGIIVSLMST